MRLADANFGGSKGGRHDAVDTCRNRNRDNYKKVGGKPQVKAHLESLGFVAGSSVTVLNTIAGNLIVNVKESRIAISREMAQKILV